MSFETKDSGERQDYVSGMQRDIQSGKPRFDLLLVDGLPYEEQFLTRFASLLARGADKYGERNWQLANSTEELDRFRASALRHMTQWATGERDEDHAVAVAFNLMAYEYVAWKLVNLDEWDCGDCGFINEPENDWCQDPSCTSKREQIDAQADEDSPSTSSTSFGGDPIQRWWRSIAGPES